MPSAYNRDCRHQLNWAKNSSVLPWGNTPWLCFRDDLDEAEAYKNGQEIDSEAAEFGCDWNIVVVMKIWLQAGEFVNTIIYFSIYNNYLNLY